MKADMIIMIKRKRLNRFGRVIRRGRSIAYRCYNDNFSGKRLRRKRPKRWDNRVR